METALMYHGQVSLLQSCTLNAQSSHTLHLVTKVDQTRSERRPNKEALPSRIFIFCFP